MAVDDVIGPSEDELRADLKRELQESALGRWALAKAPPRTLEEVTSRMSARYESELLVVDQPGLLRIVIPSGKTWDTVAFFAVFSAFATAAAMAMIFFQPPPGLAGLAVCLVLPAFGYLLLVDALAQKTITVVGSTVELRSTVGPLSRTRCIPSYEVESVSVEKRRDSEGPGFEYWLTITTRGGRKHRVDGLGAYHTPRVAALLQKHLGLAAIEHASDAEAKAREEQSRKEIAQAKASEDAAQAAAVARALRR